MIPTMSHTPEIKTLQTMVHPALLSMMVVNRKRPPSENQKTLSEPIAAAAQGLSREEEEAVRPWTVLAGAG